MLEAIDSLPEEEREVFELVRVQGLTHPEAAGVLGVSPTRAAGRRRLDRSLLLLAKELGSPPSVVRASHAMTDDPRVERLLEELLESGGNPGGVSRSCPELLPQVRADLGRLPH